MKHPHCAHREVTTYVTIKHKESSRVPSQYLVPEMIDTPCCSQGAIFLEVPNRNVVLFHHVLCEPGHFSRLLVDSNKEDLLDVWQLLCVCVSVCGRFMYTTLSNIPCYKKQYGAATVVLQQWGTLAAEVPTREDETECWYLKDDKERDKTVLSPTLQYTLIMYNDTGGH